MTIGSVRAGVAAACAMSLFLGSTLAAEAAPASQKAKLPPDKATAVTAYSSSKSPVTAEPQATGTIPIAEDEDANCTKSRKRLWVEGEGWIVRRVTTCF